jgi:tetratricopeptide (TPR) repeat protein
VELEAISKSRPTSLAGAQLGLVLLHQKKFEAAREAFRDALSARRPEPALLIGATVAAQGAGRFEDAMRACQALRRAGRVQIAAYLLANLWLSQGDAAAIRAATPTLPQGGVDLARSYDQLLPLVPRPEDRRRLALLLNLTPAYAAFGWAAEALETALAAEGIAPKSLLVGQIVAERYASAGKPEEELRVRERLAREFPDDPALGLALTRACLARRQIARAREAAEELLRRFPGNLEALLLAADAALRSDDTAAAAARACEALASHPRDPQALSVLLEALVVKGDFRDAAAAIASRARENPTFLAGPFERGILAAAEGKTDRAMEHCNIGLSRSPQDARLRLLAGLLFEERGGLAEAIGHFEVAHWVAPQSYAPTVHLARAALRLGRINLALATYHDGIRAAPDRMPLQLEFADALSYAGRSSEVAEHLRSLAPPDAATRRAIQARLARECLSQGDAARALALLEPILSEDPADALARHVAVQAYRQRDNLRAAIALCERALAEAPGADIDAQLGVLLLLDGRAQDAAERLGRAADRLKGGARSETLKWRAAALLATGQNAAEPARAAVQEAVASMGGNADSPPSSALALVLALCGLDAPAQRELDRLARSNPDAPQWVRGELAKLRGDPELLSHVLAAHAASVSGWSVRAAALLEAALARAPGDPGLLHDLALARANAGQTEKAVEAAQELTRRQPQSGTAYSLLGRALLDAEKAAPALEALRRAAALLGKQSPQPWLTLADRFSAARSVEDTIEAYRTALAIDPKHVPAANNLAWLYATERPDRLKDAELLAAAAAQKEHKVASYRDTLGWVYFLRKKPDDARREILAALELAPSQPLYLYHLGVIHFAQGRNDRARRALVRALAIDPKFQGAETARATLDILKTRTPPPKAPEPPPQPK